MRILLVYSHPVAESFVAAMRGATLKGLHQAGHEIKLIDLYAEGFDPRLSRQERLDYEDQKKNTANVAAHVEMLQWAEGLVLVFPTWWYGLPAMLHGWFDRVWVPGVAFKMAQSGKVIEPNLRNIRLVVGITSCGSPRWWMKLVGEPQKRIVMRGLRALFHRHCKKKWLAIYKMDSAPLETREKYLAKITREMSRLEKEPHPGLATPRAASYILLTRKDKKHQNPRTAGGFQMSVLVAGPEPIAGRDDLVAALEKGMKPRAEWRIGTEHEKFPFYTADHSPVPYAGPHGIQALLEGMTRFGWKPVMEGGCIIGLSGETGANISLEPGGQFELSGAALLSLHETATEVDEHLAQAKQVASEHGIGFLGLGFTPNWARDEIPVMPKGRYKIMTEYMRKVGSMGLDMMYRSCTVQVNLDFASEADMRQKMRVAIALQPLATALFANSPFTEGKPNGYLSYRSHVWTDTDRARTGMIPFVFEEGFGFERYVDYALDVPMYFVFRDGHYIDVTGQSFRDFLKGKLPGLPGETPTKGDWNNHLTTIFPEARLKSYMEMRGADVGPRAILSALSAFWVGILYDQTALNAAWDMVKDWTAEERQSLRDNVPKLGLKTPIRRETLLDIARRALAMANAGLEARALKNAAGKSEAIHLAPLNEIVANGRNQADDLLALYHGRWNGSIDPAFTERVF